MIYDWRNGGYFLMGPVAEGAVRDKRLPAVLWSVSKCVAQSYPDETYLNWVSTTSERDAELRQVLELSTGELANLKSHVTDLFNNDLVRWPNVFATLAAARAFYARWLTNLSGLRLLGVSMPASYVSGYLTEVAPASNPHDGVAGLLGENRVWEEGDAWGFEVLGSDYGAFHTYLCHGLQTELMDLLGVQFNEHGLIGDWSDAVRASEWINRDEVGAEPVPWSPWRIDRYGLEE